MEDELPVFVNLSLSLINLENTLKSHILLLMWLWGIDFARAALPLVLPQTLRQNLQLSGSTWGSIEERDGTDFYREGRTTQAIG
ncbi:MAG TPA: hypothetical protein PLH64_03635 [Anaerolineaceae bacterium]|nr:hypothetical protein [Anaerolineaceae bacterium]